MTSPVAASENDIGYRPVADRPAWPMRHSIRLRGFDYGQSGAYFITICVLNRERLLGQVETDAVRLTGAGRMILETWNDLPRHSPLHVDTVVIMPDHMHGIVMLTEVAQKRVTLSDVVRRFKSTTTVAYCRGVAQNGWRPFSGHLWQRNYHERIIRDEQELDHIREYILNNPTRYAQRESPPRP